METFGCLRAKMGRTTYYISKMTAGELIDKVGIIEELPEWSNTTTAEKIYKKYNIKRIVEDIVPYITDNPNCFFPTLIVDIYSGYDEICFEPLSKIADNIPDVYAIPMADFGVIILPNRERLVALDSQHLLLGLKIAIKGIAGIPIGIKTFPAMYKLQPHPELANEELSIIFVEHTDTAKIRKIINDINKQSKPSCRSENIITNDNDIFAVIACRLFREGEPLAPINGIDLVNSKSGTLSERSKNLTTLCALHTITKTILECKTFSPPNTTNSTALEDAYQTVASFWNTILNGMQAYQQYLNLTRNNKPVSVLRSENLLLRPATQTALAHVALITQRKGIRWESAVEKLNQIDWSFDNDFWLNILVTGDINKKMITGKESIRSAGLVIAYMIMGNQMSDQEIDDIRKIICNARYDRSVSLPHTIS